MPGKSIKQFRNIPRAVKDPNDFNAIGRRAIKDDVVTKRKTSKPGKNIGTISSNARLLRKQLAFLTNEQNQPNGGIGIILGNVILDFFQVATGFKRKSNAAHFFARARWRFFSKRRSKTTLPSRISPRLIWSMPIWISRRNSTSRP